MSAVLDTTCQKCGGAGFYEKEIERPDFLNGGHIEVVIKECFDCADEDVPHRSWLIDDWGDDD